MADRKTVIKNKLAPKDLGNAKAVAAQPEGQDKLLLGRVFGIATGTKTGTDQTGRPFIGLKGSFQGIPANPEKEIIRSGVCYLPPGMTEMVAAEFSEGVESVQFAYDIFAIKSSSPVGYGYECMPLVDVGQADPLAALAARINTPALEDKSGEAEEEVEEKATKGRKRA